jgi:hypothetical protein
LAIPDELLRNGDIAEAVLCFMDFSTGAKRWWTGFGDLVHAGYTWEGKGDAIDIGDLTSSYQMSADPITFTFAATTEMILRVRNSTTQVRGRSVIVYSQLFLANPTDGSQPWQPLGSPMALFSGLMGPMKYSSKAATSKSISLQCEGLWTRRNAPPRGLWTDRDQQARYPGDKGLERVQIYTDYEIRWV